ncbi:MAG: hypothetical protein Q7U32_04465, partial [Rhodocyclaceae bacterium]|nr:hypothetical protein [Rhodocyclaceae bacterium]
MEFSKTKIFVGIATGWTFVVGGSCWFDIHQIDDEVVELAAVEGRSHYNKDMIFRRWIALQGGLYVPPSEHTSPNHYLKDIPNRDVVTTGGQPLTLVN